MKLKRYLLLVCLLCPTFAYAQRPLTIVGGAVTANVADTNTFQVILTGNVTGVTLVSTTGSASTPVTPNTGYQVTMSFVQDATGSRTVTFGGNITSSCTINATALAVTICRWQYTASGNTWADAGGSSSSSPSSTVAIYGQTYTPFAGKILWFCAWTINLPTVTCNPQGDAISGAVASNVATLQVNNSKNWAVGNSITVTGFTGGDTFFNGTFPITAVTATSVSYALVHANASSTTTGTVTNTSGGGPFTSTSVDGTKIAFATSLAPTGGTSFGTSVLTCPRTTILSVQSTNQATLAANCTATSAASNPFFFGPDETAGLQQFAAAINAVCGMGIWPAGYALTNQATFGNPPFAACAAPIGGTRQGPDLMGQGAGESQIVIDPNMDWTTCKFGQQKNNCFFGGIGASSAGGYSVQDLGITGLGVNYTVGATTYITELEANTYARNVYITGIGASTQNLVGLATVGICPEVIGPNFQIDGAGARAWLNQVTQFCPVILTGQDFFGDVAGLTGGCLCAVDNQGVILSTGTLWGAVFSASKYVINSSAANSYFDSVGDNWVPGGSGASTVLVGVNASTAKARIVSPAGGLTYNIGGSSGLFLGVSGAVGHASGVDFVMTGASSKGVNTVAGSSFYDDCGNSYSGSIGNSILGNLFGACSITGTAALATNVTPSTGWGTTGAAGNGVTAVTGNTRLIQFTITATGTPAANPTITVAFPTAFLTAPICGIRQVGGTGAQPTLPFVVTTPTASGSGAITWTGTPVAASTYIFQLSCDLP